MVYAGDWTKDARCPVRKGDLRPGDWPVVQRLADERLVVTTRDGQGNETAELAHEALIREWAVLRNRLAADRAFDTWHRRLRDALRLWQDNGHRPDYLLHGGPLAEAATWLAERPTDLSVLEQDYIELSGALVGRWPPGAPKYEQGLLVLYTPAAYLWLLAFGAWGGLGGERAIEDCRRWLHDHPTGSDRLNSVRAWLDAGGLHHIDWSIPWTFIWGAVLLVLIPWLLHRRMDSISWVPFRTWPAWLRPLSKVAIGWQHKRRAWEEATSARLQSIPGWRAGSLRHRWAETALDKPAPTLPTTVGTALATGNHWLDYRYGLDDRVCWPHLFPRLPRILQSQFYAVVRMLDLHSAKLFWSAIITALALPWAYVDVVRGHLPIGASVIALLSLAISRRLLMWIDVYHDLKQSAYEHYRILLYEALNRAVPDDDQEVADGDALTRYLAEQPFPRAYLAKTRSFPPDLDIIEVADGWRAPTA